MPKLLAYVHPSIPSPRLAWGRGGRRSEVGGGGRQVMTGQIVSGESEPRRGCPCGSPPRHEWRGKGTTARVAPTRRSCTIAPSVDFALHGQNPQRSQDSGKSGGRHGGRPLQFGSHAFSCVAAAPFRAALCMVRIGYGQIAIWSFSGESGKKPEDLFVLESFENREFSNSGMW